MFIKNVSQVAILKIEHCKFCIRIAYKYLHNFLLFIFLTSNRLRKNCLFLFRKKYIEKSLRTERKMFELKKNKKGNMED